MAGWSTSEKEPQMPWITPKEPIVRNGQETHTPLSVKARLRQGRMTGTEATRWLGSWGIEQAEIQRIIAAGGWS